MNIKQTISFALSILLLVAAGSVACNVPPDQMEQDCYLSGVNSYVHWDGTTLNNGGSISLPATVWVKVAPNSSGTGFSYNFLTLALQYKYRVPGGSYTAWTTVKSITPTWKANFAAGPVPLFEKNSLDIPGIPASTEILIRLYCSTGVVQNADMTDDTDETGQNGWSTVYVVKVIYNGVRRPK